MRILKQSLFVVIALLSLSCLREVEIENTSNAQAINPYNYLLIGRCVYRDSQDKAEVKFVIYDLNSKPVKNRQDFRWYSIYNVEQGFSGELVSVDGATKYDFRPDFANGQGYYRLSFTPLDSVYYLKLKSANKEYESIRMEIFKGASRDSIYPIKVEDKVEDYIISIKTTEDSVAVFQEIHRQAGHIISDHYDPYSNNTKYYKLGDKGEQKISLREYINFDNPTWQNHYNLSFDEVATDFYLSRSGFMYLADQATLARNMELKTFSNNSINPFRVSESFKPQRVREDLIIEFYSYQKLY